MPSTPLADAKPYHHGDLRQALLSAAWALLEEGGLDAVTIRAVARRSGVSHAAPHHHFSSKGELVEAMVVEGFEWLTDELARAWGAHADPLEALDATGAAYIRFARERRAVFQLLNRPELRRAPGGPDAAEQAGLRAFEVLARGIERCQEAGRIPPGDSRPWTLLAWSGVHGLAMLLDSGLLDAFGGTDDDDYTRLLIQGLHQGLVARGQWGSSADVPG